MAVAGCVGPIECDKVGLMQLILKKDCIGCEHINSEAAIDCCRESWIVDVARGMSQGQKCCAMAIHINWTVDGNAHCKADSS